MKKLAAQYGGTITPTYYFNFGVFAIRRKHVGLLEPTPAGRSA
jgi:hypothetical protein